MRAVLIKKISWMDSKPLKCKRSGTVKQPIHFAVQMDYFLYFNKVLYTWNDDVRWMLQLHLACFSLCVMLLLTHVSLFQRMYVTSSARPQFITTFPSTGTVSSSGYTSAMKETRTSATQSSPSFCRYIFDLYNHRF